VVAGLLENTMLAMPVPAGGDPGQWASTSYAYVGLPFPSWVVPGQYPPMLFPILGVLVRLGGGPIAGARAFVGLAAVLVGLSAYFLARGLTRRRSTALVAEALVLLNPTFLQMFFWGFYPNLLGLVFLNLTLAFLVRFLRSKRPFHVLLFWTCAAATVLSHSLVGVILVAALGVFFVLALSIKAVPREIYRSRASLAGIAIFLVSVGGFYASTALLRIPHPNYLQSGAFAYVRNGVSAIFNLLTRPWFHGLKLAPPDALALLAILGVGLALYAVGLRVFWKHRMTLGTMAALALALSPVVLAGLGWELSVVTDYGRFSYFLVTPLALAIGLLLDRFMTEANRRRVRAPAWLPAPKNPSPRWRPGGPHADSPAALFGLAVVAVTVLVLADVVSVRSLPGDEAATTKVGHDATFLHALDLIRATGVQGSLLTVPGVAKWSRALLVRDAYFPNLAARYTFDPTHLVDEETAYFALTSRYTATNGEVAVTALGTNLASGNRTFEYQPAYFGVFTPVAALPVAEVNATVVRNGAPVSSETIQPVTSGGTVVLAPAGPSSFSISYTGTGFVLTVTVATSASTPVATIVVSAAPSPGYRLLGLSGNLTGPSAGTARFDTGNSPGSLDITPGKFGTALATGVQVTPKSALGAVAHFNHPNNPAHAAFAVQAPTGASALAVSFAFVTPTASNLVSGLPPLLTTDSVWANWTVRFVLYSNSSTNEGTLANLLPDEVSYLEREFGAKLVGISGGWTVLIVPPAGSLPSGPRTSLVGPPGGGAPGGPSPSPGMGET